MTEPFRHDSPDEFFHDRRDWFRMDVMPTDHGNWAVVLVLDEGYDRESAARVSKRYAWQIAKALAHVFNRAPRSTTRFRQWLGQGAGIADLALEYLAEEKRKDSALDGLEESA